MKVRLAQLQTNHAAMTEVSSNWGLKLTSVETVKGIGAILITTQNTTGQFHKVFLREFAIVENSFAAETEVKWKAQLKIRDYQTENTMTGEHGVFSLAYEWIQTNDISGSPLNLTAVATDARQTLSTRIRVLNDLNSSSPTSWTINTANYANTVNGAAQIGITTIYNTQFSPRGRFCLLGRTENTLANPMQEAMALFFVQKKPNQAPFLQLRITSNSSELQYRFAAFPNAESDNPVILARDKKGSMTTSVF